MSYRIDEHCDEDWDAMELHERGRFCQRCEHSVIDATEMTKGEFEALYNDAKGELCVQFRANPVGDGVFRRDLIKPRSLGSFVLLSTLLASACAGEAPLEAVAVPLVAPGCQLVEDKTPVTMSLSSPDVAVDAGVDVSDAAPDAIEHRPIRRGRVRRHRTRTN